MSHKKAGGSTKNLRDSQSKRLGVKAFGGQTVGAGAIIIRQRGTQYFPGENTLMGKDHTIFAKVNGTVKFGEKKQKKYDGRVFKDQFVSVIKAETGVTTGKGKALKATKTVKAKKVAEAVVAEAVVAEA